MITLACPWCGDRTESEFSCHGDAHVVRPKDWQNTTDADWSSYLHMESNPAGVLAERWHHWAGCGEWFNVVRNTRTNEIIGVYVMGVERPQNFRGQRDGI